jgi:hypothetical protein
MLQRLNGACHSNGTCNRRDTRDVVLNGSRTDGFFIKMGSLAQGGIDDKVNAATADKVHDVWASFVDFENEFDWQTGCRQHFLGAAGGNKAEA